MLRFLIIVALLAAVIYLFFWLLQRRRGNGGSQAPLIERGPVGPDDDEDFLRELDWKRHRDERHRPPEPPAEPTG